MNSNDFFYLRICFNTGISLWICIVHNCLRNKSTRNASHYFMQILIYCVKQKLTVILLMELWYYIPAVPPMLSVIHFFSITGKHAMLLSCFVFFVGLEEEILQYGGGHERKDPSILQGSSTQLHGNWQGKKSLIYYHIFIFHQPKLYISSEYFYCLFDYLQWVFFSVIG